MAEQVLTRNVSLTSVVGSAAFRAGVDDYLKGATNFDYWCKIVVTTKRRTKKGWMTRAKSQDWNYERGRLFAATRVGQGKSIPRLRDEDRKISRDTLGLVALAFQEGNVI